jgi:hypothetical protein
LQAHERNRERISRYRRLAEEAREQAEESTDADTRAKFLAVAKGWDQLGERLDRRLH